MIRQAVGVLAYVGLFAVLLFWPAGTLHWRAAWVLLAVLLVVRGASTASLYRHQAALLAERAKFPVQRGQLGLDRILLPLFMASFAGLVAFASLDRWRLHLMPPTPVLLRVPGLVAFVAGWWIIHLTLRENAFAVTVVRHQEERAQRVVSSGPYAVVRHPMYAGIIPVMAGMGLWLGSTAAAMATLVPVAILALRIGVEERMLRRVLDGYAEYAARVRWRLVPRVW